VIVNIWCDGSIRRTKLPNTKKCPRAAFAAFCADTGHYWYDQIYANKSSDAELSAVMVGLLWASQQGFNRIIIHTDDQTIPGNLYGPNQGNSLGDLRVLIESCAAEVEIIYIPRSQNGQAHRLCNLAYKEYLKDHDKFHPLLLLGLFRPWLPIPGLKKPYRWDWPVNLLLLPWCGH
jgi:hypothetical protein